MAHEHAHKHINNIILFPERNQKIRVTNPKKGEEARTLVCMHTSTFNHCLPPP